MVKIVCRFGNLKVFLSLLSLAFLSVENVHQMFMFNWFTDCLWILFLSNYKVMSFHLAATSYTCTCSLFMHRLLLGLRLSSSGPVFRNGERLDRI